MICVSSVTVSPASLKLYKGCSVYLSAEICPANAGCANITWSSSNTEVATVNRSSGLVMAQGAGTAVITASANDGSGKKDTCCVTVSEEIPVCSVSLDATRIKMNEGTKYTLTATVCPENATDRSLTWSSSNTETAVVSSSGQITAISAGTAVIRATANDGSGEAACCTVTVKEKVPASSVIVSPACIELSKGTAYRLCAGVFPTTATTRSVTWCSSNTAVATVNSAGRVCAVGVGTAVISATANDGTGKRGCCTVTVGAEVSVSSMTMETELSLNVNSVYTLSPVICPRNASDKTVTWSTSNPSVATVNSCGMVITKGEGQAVITATANDGSGCSASTAINVINNTKVNMIVVSPAFLRLNLETRTSALANAAVLPVNAADRTITWTSDDTSVATVTSSGLVMAQGVGTTSIVATANDGSSIYGQLYVSVSETKKETPIGTLSDSQILLLNNLIYLDGIWNGAVKSVCEAIAHFDENGLGFSEDSQFNNMSYEEWMTIINNIRRDEALMSLKIEHPIENSKGMRVATFVDSCNNAYAVFRGTHEDYEWFDNGFGGHMSDTPSQLDALAYIENTLGYYINCRYVGDDRKPYNSLTVSGHSKGGNKAQYVTITSSVVDRCVSFDGQGFGMEFITKYGNEILKRAEKITSISCEFDYVNCLFFMLPIPEQNRIYINAPDLDYDILKYHCPSIMLDNNANFYATTEATIITKLFNAISIFACSNLEGEIRENLMRDIMNVFVNKKLSEANGVLDAAIVLLDAVAPYLATISHIDLLKDFFSNYSISIDIYTSYFRLIVDLLNEESIKQLGNSLDNACFSNSSVLLEAITNSLPEKIKNNELLFLIYELLYNILYVEKKAESLKLTAGDSMSRGIIVRTDNHYNMLN